MIEHPEAYIRGDILAYLQAYTSETVPYPPGGFLTAVLENDLMMAYGRADSYNLSTIPAIVSWLHNKAPGGCFGYKGAVKKWLARKQEHAQDQ